MVSAKWTSVTRKNFAEILPKVVEDIKSAEFVALDTELTGLQLTRAHRNSVLDDLETRYGKLKESVSNFGLLQVGLSCFKWNASRQKYKISAYSFYVFPSAANSLQQERKFSCQLGSLTFLSEFKFDFNKAFHEGIPFITRKEEVIIKSNSVFYAENGSEKQHQQQQSQQKPLILLKDEEKAIVSEVFEKIDLWLSETEQEEEKPVDSSNLNASTGSLGSKFSLDLPPMNSYQRLIFYQQIPLNYGDKLIITKKSNGILSVKKVDQNPEAREAAFQEEKNQFEKALEEQIGFRRVMDALMESQVPVIGHNCLVDFLHFYQKFVDNNLPPTISGFKEEILKCFPLIIDTKFLARLVEIKNSSLGDLTELASNYQEVSYFSKQQSSETGEDEEESASQFHDAGFDAICTGRVFLCLLKNFLRPKELSETSLNSSLEILLKNEALCNRLNLLQSDYAHMNLMGPEIEPNRSNVVYIYNISGSPSVSDLQNTLKLLINDSSEAATNISCQIHWLSDSSACFAQFEKSEQAQLVLSAFTSFRSADQTSANLSISARSTDQSSSTLNVSSTSINSSASATSSPTKCENLLNKIRIVSYAQYQEKRDRLLYEGISNDDQKSNKRNRLQ